MLAGGEERDSVDRNLEAQKDQAKADKEMIANREKNQVNAIEQDAKARERQERAGGCSYQREAAAAGVGADKAKVQADQAERRTQQANQ